MQYRQLHPTLFQRRLCFMDDGNLCAVAWWEFYALTRKSHVPQWWWLVRECELCTEMVGAHVSTNGHEKVEGTGARWLEGGGGQRERGDTTGGTYCQVGPRGVARVAPLSDSTHKRGGGQKH